MGRWHRGGIVLERSMRRERGIGMLRHTFVGDDTRVIVTHRAALRSLVRVDEGRIVFPLASGDVVAPPRFLLAVPAHSVVRIRFERARVETDGTGATHALDDHRVPAIEAASAEPARAAITRHGAVLQQLDADLGVASSLVAARAKLHEVIGDHAPVRTAAACVDMAPETFTRLFTAAYGIAPKQYCHRARLFDAALLLFSGTSVLDAALRAGFNDLTRFYVQFRRLLGATPGDYVRIRNRQDPATAVS